MNYRDVIKEKLAPAGSEGKATCDETKPDNHIPGTDTGNRVLGVGDVVGNDPAESAQKGANHRRREPAWRFEGGG